MPRPNPDAKHQILIVDDGKYKVGFSSESSYPTTRSVDEVLGRALPNRYEITRVDHLHAAERVVESTGGSTNLPFFTTIVLSRSAVSAGSANSPEMGGMAIERIGKKQPYLPIVLYGNYDLSSNEEFVRLHAATEKAQRRGVRYDPLSKDELLSVFQRIFWLPDHGLPSVGIVKFGGSAFDYCRERRDHGALVVALNKLYNYHFTKRLNQRDHRMILFNGGGQVKDAVGDHLSAHDVKPRDHQILVAQAVEMNSRILQTYLTTKRSEVVSPHDYYFLFNSDPSNKVTLMPIAPNSLLARDRIPLKDSDTQGIAIAEDVQAERVILLKRTDGVYSWDPHRGGFTGDIKKWGEQQRGNKMHREVRASEILEGIITNEGTTLKGDPDGDYEHLMERTGLEYFLNCKRVKEIAIVPIAPQEMYVEIGGTFRHIVSGDSLELGPNGWHGELERRLEEALEGNAPSKIVRA